MKTYAIGLDERVEKGKNFYIVPCGTSAFLRLDGRENVHKHMESTIECMEKRGYKNFVVIKTDSLLDDFLSRVMYKHIEKAIPITE